MRSGLAIAPVTAFACAKAVQALRRFSFTRTAILAGLIGAIGCTQAPVPRQSGLDLLQEARAMYAAMDGYRDRGVVTKKIFTRDDETPVEVQTEFETYVQPTPGLALPVRGPTEPSDGALHEGPDP
jgi:hypothetical protein